VQRNSLKKHSQDKGNESKNAMVKVNQVKSKYKSQRDALMADTNAIKELVGIRVCSRCTNDFFESEEDCKVCDKYRNDFEILCTCAQVLKPTHFARKISFPWKK